MSIDSLERRPTQFNFNAHRPTLAGRRYAVSAGHYLAAQTAFAILGAEGNAVDAGVAAGLVLGVVQSELVNIAGVAPIIIYLAATDEVVTIPGLGHWPMALDPQRFVREYQGHIPEGLLRTVVPAAPDAWIGALSRYGTLSFSEVAAEAIRFAREGFVMDPLMSELITTFADGYRRWESNGQIYLPGGQPPKPGDLFVQSDLARTLQYMVDCEKAVLGKGRLAGLEAARSAFYSGDIARTIVRYHEENGGLLTMADLASFRVTPDAPVAMDCGGARLYTCGPWCQGPTLLQVLAILDGYDLKSLGHNSADYLHLVTEAIKLAFSDRHSYYGDPRFVNVPIKELISAEFAKQRRDRISTRNAATGMPPPGNLGVSAFSDSPTNTSYANRLPSLDTSYVAVIDQAGNAFSATPSDVSFDTPVIPGTGICPSSRGSQSWGNPECPSGVAPGKRPRLTPNPALARYPDGSVVAFGSPGGDVQIQAMLQVWLNATLFGMDLQAAVEAPRIASYSFPDSFEPHAYSAGQLNVESRLSGAVTAELTARGHVVSEWPDWTWRAGSVCIVRRNGSTGNLEAAADPRRPCYALAW